MDRTIEVTRLEQLLHWRLQTPGEGVVRGVYRHSVNVETQGLFFTVLHPTPDSGPACAILAEGADFSDLGVLPGQTVRWERGALEMGGLRLVFSGATVCDCRFGAQALPLPDPAAAARRLEALLAPAAQKNAARWGEELREALDQRAGSVCAALEQRADPAGAVRQLVGFGPGLTPSGDDILTGLYAALRVLGGGAADLEGLEQALAACAGRTTQVGGWMLTCALDGRWRASLQAVLAACADPALTSLPAAVEQLLTVGASSGYDMCSGVHRALCLVSRLNRSEDNG